MLQNTEIIWFSNLSILSVPDEGYSRNVPDEGYSRNVPDEGYSMSESFSINLIQYLRVLLQDKGYSYIKFKEKCKVNIYTNFVISEY